MTRRKQATSVVTYGFGNGCVGFVGPHGRREFMTVEEGGEENLRIPLSPWLARVLIEELAPIVAAAKRRAAEARRRERCGMGRVKSKK